MKLSILLNSLFLLYFLLVISACSSKNQPNLSTQKNETNKTIVHESIEDEFENEFEATKQEVYDPFEPYNRGVHTVNDKFFISIFHPISQGYETLVPEVARIGISNIVHNLKFPVRFSNNLLQFKFDSSMKELGRFMINSTIGIFGIFDLAKAGGIEPQEEDFGQTLAFYGVGPGPHFVIPFFGPSNLRDSLGLILDSSISPTNNGTLAYQIPKTTVESMSITGVEYLNKHSLHPGEYQSLRKDAIDVYTFFRDSYEQKRANDIEK